MDADRARLARWIDGTETPSSEWIADEHADSLVNYAQSEGVVCLLDSALRRNGVGAGNQRWAGLLRQAARQQVLESMRMEGEYRRILDLLSSSGVPVLVLKGSALAHWAYASPHLRACGDLDLLVPSRDDAQRVLALLSSLGYRSLDVPGGLATSALMCAANLADGGLEVDVHWRLNHSAVYADVFGFDELMTDSIPLPKLAPGARGLGPVHAMLHAAVHRARNLENGLGDPLKWLYDFVVLAGSFAAPEWDRLLLLAEQKRLAGVTVSALESARAIFTMSVPSAVLDRLHGLATGEPVDHHRLDDWRYMQRQAWKALPDSGARARWVWQRLFPSADYLRQAYRMDGAYPALLWERARRFWTKWRLQ